jgi:methylthioribose-1-phosphate isomerase
MKVAGVPRRTIEVAEDGAGVEIIDQTLLPHEFATLRLATLDAAAEAIRAMRVRGAPLIGVTAAYGLCFAVRADPSDAGIEAARRTLLGTRPTAVNLRSALDHMCEVLGDAPEAERPAIAWRCAATLAEQDVETCRRIGEHGLKLIEAVWERTGRARPVDLLTHCNAGWLAAVDWGTALAPVYLAHDRGIDVHVWVDETRPRGQGARLTAWELLQHGVPHTVIADNAGGHLMQRGRVDLCITGADRVTSTAAVCNKIGTYLKALAAHDTGVPFYVAVPHTTIDWTLGGDGAEIPIEERDGRELSWVAGRTRAGEIVEVEILPEQSPVANLGFDVTPARLVTGLVTERGVCEASAEGLRRLYPDEG